MKKKILILFIMMLTLFIGVSNALAVVVDYVDATYISYDSDLKYVKIIPSSASYSYPRIKHKYDSTGKTYLCISGLEVNAGHNASCEVSDLLPSHSIGVAYIIRNIASSGTLIDLDNKLHANNDNTTGAFNIYYWQELAVLKYISKLNVEQGYNVAAVNNAVELIENSTSILGDKTIDSVIEKAKDYQKKYGESKYDEEVKLVIKNKDNKEISNLTFKLENETYVSNWFYVDDINGNAEELVLNYGSNSIEDNLETKTSNGVEYYRLVFDSSEVNAKTISSFISFSGGYLYYDAITYDCVNNNVQDYVSTNTEEKESKDSARVDFSISSGQITIKKVDESNKPLPGATIKITGPNNYSKTIKMENGKIVIKNLSLGTYTIEEVAAPTGYNKSTTSEKVTLSATKLSGEATITNQKQNKLTIKKTDITGTKPLANAVLEIQNADGTIAKFCTNAPNKECKWKSTTGAWEVSNIPDGTYYVVEVSAPDGYTITEKAEFKVIDGKLNTQEIVMKNALTSVKIIKISEDKKPLSGAELQLEDDEAVVKSCLINGKLTEPCSWESTKEAVEITGLLSGDYWIVETKAPENYVKANDIGFTIDEDGKTIDSDEKEVKTNIEVINTLPIIKILKINEETRKPLAGAKLRIIDESENVLYEWTSTEDFYEIDPLPYGTYYVVEVSAPKGYALSDKKEKFEINDSTKFIKIMFENNKDYDVPDTLSSKSALLIAFAMLNIGLGIGIVIYVKKNKVTE